MIVFRATRKLLDRLPRPAAVVDEPSTTALGDWYATVLLPRQVALFVSASTRLPVLLPLAPAATVFERFDDELAAVLRLLAVDEADIARECDVSDHRLAATRNRSVVGSMNEFAFLAQFSRSERGGVELSPDALRDMSIQLAKVPCGPLYARHVSPDREVGAVLRSWSSRG